MSGITVISPNSRRCKLKIAPNTQLRKVLEESCLKLGFDIETHELRYQNRILDLALSFRLSGLPNNATVEIVQRSKSNQPIQIALQLPDGTRITSNFTGTANLFEMLETFSADAAKDLINCGDGRAPSCAYMNREYRGEAELKATTLEAMGITGGRSLIRYSTPVMTAEDLQKVENRLAEENLHKKKLEETFGARKAENERRMKLEEEREQAFEKELADKRIAEEAAEQNTRQIIRGTRMSPTVEVMHSTEKLQFETPASVETTAPIETPSSAANSRLQGLQWILDQVNASIDNNATDSLGETLISEDGRLQISRALSAAKSNEAPTELHICVERCDRNALVIEPDSSADLAQEEAAAHAVDEQFFELTIEDARNMQRHLRTQANMQQQRALVPKAYIERKNKELKENSYKHTVVRFLYSDGTTIQAQFISKEAISRLFEFIEQILLDRSQKFEISFALNRKLKSSDRENLVDISVAPKSTLFLKMLSPPHDFSKVFAQDQLPAVSRSKADEMSKQWLSSNKRYHAYEPVIPVANDIRPKRQSPESSFSECAPSKQPQTSGSMPKWFKKQ